MNYKPKLSWKLPDVKVSSKIKINIVKIPNNIIDNAILFLLQNSIMFI